MKRKNAPLNVALVGCGSVVQTYHCPALAKLENRRVARIAAIYDPSPAAQKIVQSKFPAATIVRDLDELRDSEIDFAIIGSPSYLHAVQSIKLLSRGIAVLCEKPMALSLSEAESMIEAAAANQTQLAVGHLGRYGLFSKYIHEALAGGTLGELLSISAQRGSRVSGQLTDNWRFKKECAGGGVLIDVGVHLIDLVFSFCGSEIEVLSYEDDSLYGIEANCRALLQFAPGKTVELRLSRDFRLPLQYRLQCANGWVEHLAAVDCVQIGYNDDNTAGVTRTLPPSSKETVQTFERQLDNFCDALLGKCELLIPGTEAIKTLAIVEQCYQMKKLMPMPWLDDLEIESAERILAGRKKC